MAVISRQRILLLILLRRHARKKKRSWVRHVNIDQLRKGEYQALIHVMRVSDHDSFYKNFRMTPSRFDSPLRRKAVISRQRVLLLILLRRHARKKKRSWVRHVNIAQPRKGEYQALIQEIRFSDHDSF